MGEHDAGPVVAAGDVLAWPWWRDVAERIARQAQQTAVPILAVMVAAPGETDMVAAVTVLVTTLALTGGGILLKALTGVTSGPGSSWLRVLLDRVLSAAAATMLGFWPVSWAGMYTLCWRDVAVASVASGVLAVVTWWATPPAAPLQRALASAGAAA